MAGLASMGNPADAVKAIADKIKQDVQESGMDAAEAFVGKLEELKDKAQKGPGDLLDNVKGAISSIKERIDKAMEDPASLAPSSGPLVALASWYGNAVANKLKSLAEEVQKLFSGMESAAKDITQPLKDVGDSMGTAMEGINKTVKGLMSLPTQITDLSNTVQGADDLKNVDTTDMKNSLNTEGIEQPLDDLGGLKDTLAPLAENVKPIIQQVSEFVGGAADAIRNAFAVPAPLCCMTGCALSQAPPVMKELLDNVEVLKGFDLEPVKTMLEELADNVGNLDVEKVKGPVKKFAEAAQGSVDNLDNAVNAAKMAANVPSMPTGAPKFGGFGR